MSRRAAALILSQVTLKPDSVLGLATGSSPIGTYEAIVKAVQEGDADLSQVRTVNLDEYVGLGPDHPQSYAYFMKKHLFEGAWIPPQRWFIPDGTAKDPEAECRRYDELLKSLGGVDLVLLGLGNNGHIGFNEPGDSFSMGTHLIELTTSTRQANRRFFDSLGEVPTHAYTMGIRDLFRSRRVIMLVSGKGKAEILKKAFTGPVTPRVPASILQYHSDFTLVADTDALSLMDQQDP